MTESKTDKEDAAAAEEVNEQSSSIPDAETVQSCDEEETGVFEHLEQLFDKGYKSDLKVKVKGGKTYHLHQAFMARSSVLRSMMDKNNGAELQLEEEEDSLIYMTSFLKYLYTGNLNITTDGIIPLSILANKYKMTLLKERIHNLFDENPTSHLLCNAYPLVVKHNLEDLVQRITHLIQWNLVDVLGCSSSASDLSKELIINFLQQSDIVVESEFYLFQAVIKWIQTKTALEKGLNKQEVSLELLVHIRYTMMSVDKLREAEAALRDLLGPEMFCQYFIERILHAFKFQSYPRRERNIIQLETEKPRLYLEFGHCVTPAPPPDMYPIYNEDEHRTLHVTIPAFSAADSRRVSSASKGQSPPPGTSREPDVRAVEVVQNPTGFCLQVNSVTVNTFKNNRVDVEWVMKRQPGNMHYLLLTCIE